MTVLMLPITDRRGDSLISVERGAEADVERIEDPPCPLALVVVADGERVLFGRNRWRKTWELPGGMIDPGETPRDAAARELHEETGIQIEAAQLEFVGIVVFDLVDPRRTERAAIFRAEAGSRQAAGSYELTEVAWFAPGAAPEDANVLDAAIAVWALSTEGDAVSE